jgi:hypothetical protein
MSNISNNSNINQIQININNNIVTKYLSIDKYFNYYPYRLLTIGYKDYTQYHYKYIYSNHIIHNLNLIFNYNQ